MGIKEDYQKAQQFYKEGKYIKARNLLEPYKDHNKIKPAYDKVIEKLSEKPYGKFQILPKQQRNTTYGCLALIVFLCICSVWIAFLPSSETDITSDIDDGKLLTTSFLLAPSDFVIDPLVQVRTVDGTREAIVTFITASELEGIGAVFGVTTEAIRTFDLNIDTITAIAGRYPDGQILMTATTSYHDTVAFLDGLISVETWFQRMQISN